MLTGLKRFLRLRLDAYVRHVQDDVGHDIPFQEQLEARREAAEFVRNELMGVRRFDRQDLLLRYCLAQSPATGAVCEFGVASGRTTNLIAELVRPRIVHGFDSFQGLPEDWRPGFAKGTFTMRGKPPVVRPNVTLHVGWFDQTVVAFRAGLTDTVAFLHVDCDLYSSTRIILEALHDLLAPGTVILFDEYFNYPGWRDHEYRAFTELADAYAVRYRYLAFNQRGEQVAVQIE